MRILMLLAVGLSAQLSTASSIEINHERRAILACKMQAIAITNSIREKEDYHPFSNLLESCNTNYRTLRYHTCVKQHIKSGAEVSHAVDTCDDDSESDKIAVSGTK